MKHKHELAQLIDDVVSANGWAGADVARRATAAGYALSQQNVSRIKSDPVVTFSARQARALAAGLNVPVNVVIDATLRAMGFTFGAGTPAGVEEAIRLDEHLGVRDRRVLLAVLHELRASDEEVVGNAEHPAPRTGPTDRDALGDVFATRMNALGYTADTIPGLDPRLADLAIHEADPDLTVEQLEQVAAALELPPGTVASYVASPGANQTRAG